MLIQFIETVLIRRLEKKNLALISLLDINWSKAKTTKAGNKAVLTSG